MNQSCKLYGVLLTWLTLLGCLNPAAGRSLVPSGMQLANNAVLAMYQDESGNMWVGTYDGLHLYDGKETFVYRMELDNDHSLSSNIILRIVPAEPGFLWIATSLGINKFSLDKRCVTETCSMEAAEVENIVADHAGNTLLFAGDDFITCCRPDRRGFAEIPMPGVRRSEIVTVWADSPGNFGTLDRNGLLVRYRMSTSGALGLTRESERRISKNPVRKATCSGGMLCFVDEKGLLWRYDCREGTLVGLSDLSSLRERGLTVSSIQIFDNAIYVGFFAGGLGRIPREGGPCELISPDYRIYSLLPDRYQDILWVGTDGYGAFMYCDKQVPFTTLLLDRLPQKVLKPVRALCTDRDGSLWVGTKGGGVIRIQDYDATDDTQKPSRGLASHVRRFDTRDGLASNEVFAFCPSISRNVLWIGTSGPGISYFDYGEGRIRTLTAPAGMPAIRHVHEICQTDSSTLFVASDTEALVELTIGRGERPAIRSMRRYRFRLGQRDCNGFYAMIRESDSTLLLGLRGGYGLIRFNIRSRIYEFVDMQRLQRRALGDLLSLCRSHDSKLYCGTSSGLIQLTQGGDIRQFDRRSGIANDMIHGVLEDTHGCIWLSTNKGLAQYNPKTDFFHNYTAPDLDVIEFCDDAYWKCPYTGRLFFGGVNGVVWVDPTNEIPQGYRPALQFTGVEYADGSRTPLPRPTASGYAPLRIGPGVAGFSVSFVAIDYLNGENFEYACRLEGKSTEWTELQKNNRVTFSDLAPGEYRLEVRYKSNVLDYVDAVYALPIVVLPPWYRTTAALILYVLGAAGAVVLGIRAVRRHYRRQQQQIVRRLEEETREKLTEARVNFFVNISHELCTPLTLINGMNDRIAEAVGDNPDLAKYTEVMRENVRGLNNLIQEILDFRKIEEAGFGRVRILPVAIGELLSPLVRSFDDAAARNGIELLLEVAPALVWNTDASFLKKITLNLLSNAMKYTPREGRIRITAECADSTLVLRVWNSGRGIEPAQLDRIFDRYRILDDMDRNMYTDSASRNGLGLFICHGLVQALEGEITVRSEVGQFAEFTVRLPHREVTEPAAPKEECAETPLPAGPQPDEKPSVLVVDDNRDILWLIESALSSDYRVRACRSVAEALTVLERMVPDLIVTDLVMAGADGLDLIAHIRRDRILQSLPIIVVSAKVTEDEQIEGLDAGADAYLTKPFSVEVLRATAARLISSRRMLKEYYNAPESAYTVVEGQKMHRTDKEFMDAVVSAIHEYLEREDLQIDLIAERFGLTARNFSRKFKKVSGRTPSEFIKEMRFEQAARLLKTTHLTIQEIMYRVGISNKSYFYREFQRKYGVKPREFRQS